MSTATLTVEERVANGVRWLDENAPEWRSKVDPAQLDMISSCQCVLGQVYEAVAEAAGRSYGYWYVLDEIVQPPDGDSANAWARVHGFTAGFLAGDDEWRALESAWYAELTEPATEPVA